MSLCSGSGAKCFPVDGQGPTLFVSQYDLFFAKLFQQSLNLGISQLYDLLLTLMHLRRKRHQCQVPGLQDGLHVVTGCSTRKTLQHFVRST